MFLSKLSLNFIFIINLTFFINIYSMEEIIPIERIAPFSEIIRDIEILRNSYDSAFKRYNDLWQKYTEISTRYRNSPKIKTLQQIGVNFLAEPEILGTDFRFTLSGIKENIKSKNIKFYKQNKNLYRNYVVFLISATDFFYSQIKAFEIYLANFPDEN